MFNPARSRLCAIGSIALGLCLHGTHVQAAETADAEASVDTQASGDAETDDVAQAQGETFLVELYTPPRSKERATPVYPHTSLNDYREGWVRLEFMVDPQGKPYEIAVSESMGDRSFERASLRALEKSTFEPARVDGQPADAGHSMQYIFALEGGSNGAGAWFARTHKAALRVIAEGDREKADEKLASLERQTKLNLYEDAYLHVAKYNYYAKWGDKHQQLRALDRAVAHEFAQKHLPEELFVSCQRARFMLLIETQDYERAVQTHHMLRGFDVDESLMAGLGSVVDKLEDFRADDRAYTVPGDFGERTSWSYNLFKDEFLIRDVEGDIAEIKLRCRASYVFFRFEPDTKYKVDGGENRCHLQLVGNPGTTFTLTQL